MRRLGHSGRQPGIIAGVANAVGVQTKFTDTELGDLNCRNINVIRPVIGSGICVMGARTRKGYGPDRYISARRVLIDLKEQLRRSTQYADLREQRRAPVVLAADHRRQHPAPDVGAGWPARSLRPTRRTSSSATPPSTRPPSSPPARCGWRSVWRWSIPAEFVVIRITQITTSQFPNEVQPLG